MSPTEPSESDDTEWDADEQRYTRTYPDALRYAAVKHRYQVRKGSEVPYVTHPMAVSSLVWAHGGDEEQAIAGLLHDTVEDCGGPPVLVEIRTVFGERVAAIVDAATDSTTTDKADKLPWLERKTRHIAKMATVSQDAALVIACDKLHNMSQTAAEYQREGEAVFAKFNPDADARWYYRQMRDALAPRIPPTLLQEIDRNLETLGA